MSEITMLPEKLARIGLLLAILSPAAFAGEHFLLRASPEKIDAIAARHNLTKIHPLKGSAEGLFQIEADSEKAGKLAKDADVQSLEADDKAMLPEAAPGSGWLSSVEAVKALGTPAEGSFFNTTTLDAYITQPAGQTVNLAGSRTISTGEGAVVAVLDTGVDPRHPDLSRSIVAGYDFTRDNDDVDELLDIAQSTSTILDQSTSTILDALQSTSTILDKTQLLVVNPTTTVMLAQSTSTILDDAKLPEAFGHGTMVAGVIHLVAPRASIMPIKVFDGNGASNMSQIIAGIYWAVDHGANVINMSFSSTSRSKELQRAIFYAISKGVVCVASAGNDGNHTMVFPAGYNVIAVGSTNDQMVRSAFSNYGNDVVDLAAPGERVITLYPGGNYAAAWGTSFSAPFVAGGAALMAAEAATDQNRAKQVFDQAAIPIGQQLGRGELDLFTSCLYRAVRRD